jgi:hypothetical protein
MNRRPRIEGNGDGWRSDRATTSISSPTTFPAASAKRVNKYNPVARVQFGISTQQSQRSSIAKRIVFFAEVRALESSQ